MTRLKVPRLIPAIRQLEEWRLLQESAGDPKWAFVLGGTIDAVAEMTGLLQKRGWTVFVHVDMVRGLSGDSEGIKFFAGYVGSDGIISTHSQAIAHAKKVGLMAIQRIFLLDSQSVTTGVQQVLSTHPDAVEVLPGLLPAVARRVVDAIPYPVIAGGLIQRREEMDIMLAAGVQGISTSQRTLWTL